MRLVRGRIVLRGGLLALAVVLALAGVPAQAGKPSRPPPPPVDSGAIYFYVANAGLYVTEPDGSDKTLVSTTSLGTASQALHGQERWFLKFKEIENAAPYHDGMPRQELFATDDEGHAYQLTDDPDVEPNPGPGGPRPAWAKDSEIVDGKVSFA